MLVRNSIFRAKVKGAVSRLPCTLNCGTLFFIESRTCYSRSTCAAFLLLTAALTDFMRRDQAPTPRRGHGLGHRLALAGCLGCSPLKPFLY